MQELLDRYHEYKNSRMMDSDKKINFYKDKEELNKNIKKIPAEASELLSGVNVFKDWQTELKPEYPVGPFICDSSIRRTENELLVLSRGPKFMVRENLSVDEFNIEVEKMICKRKNLIMHLVTRKMTYPVSQQLNTCQPIVEWCPALNLILWVMVK